MTWSSKSETDMTDRARGVLRVLIQEYVQTGRPVGSRRLSKIYSEGLSPATLRNVMSDLEEMGLVEQPHTSAGRVPTPQGFRLYVQSLRATRPPQNERHGIEEILSEESDPRELMDRVSQLLSVYSNNLGFVLSPRLSQAVLEHIEFFKMRPRRILVILVTRGGLVQHRVIQMDEELSQTDLDQASRYLVANFSGRALSDIRKELLRRIAEERIQYDRLLRNVLLLGSRTLIASDDSEEDDSRVSYEGASRLLQKLEGEETDHLIALLQTFEQKNRVVQLISACLEEDQNGPSVRIGLDEFIPGMADWTLITSAYEYDQRVKGTLGILGPVRMEYAKTIGLVDYVAQVVGSLLSSHNR